MIQLPQLQFQTLGPSGGQSVNTPPLDGGRLPPPVQNVIAFVDAPAQSVSQLPNGETVTYTLLEGNDPTFGSVISSTTLGTQTGSGGAGAAAALFGARPKFVGGQYLGLRITASSGANVSAETFILSFAFGTAAGIHA